MQLFLNQIKPYGPTCRRCLSLFQFSIHSLWGKGYIFSLHIMRQKFSISISHKSFVRACELISQTNVKSGGVCSVIFTGCLHTNTNKQTKQYIYIVKSKIVLSHVIKKYLE